MSIEEKKAALANKSRAKREARREEMKRSERFRKMYRCNTEGEEVGNKFKKFCEVEGPNGVRHIWIRHNDDKDPFWMLMVNGTKYCDSYDYKTMTRNMLSFTCSKSRREPSTQELLNVSVSRA